MGHIRRLVLDTLKPHEPSSIVLADQLSELDGVNSVNVSSYEVDMKVENVKVTIEGDDIQYKTVLAVIKKLGAAVHSIDQVVAGKDIIDDARTPQD